MTSLVINNSISSTEPSRVIVAEMPRENRDVPETRLVRNEIKFLLMQFNCNYRQEIRRSKLYLVKLLPAITETNNHLKRMGLTFKVSHIQP